MDKFIRKLLILPLLLAVLITQPVFAADEEEQNPVAAACGTVREIAYESAYLSTLSKGEYFWRISATGEAEKSDGGVYVTPVGDPEAAAPELDAKGAALYSYDLGKIVYAKNENERLEPYSTTKLLTCWLALQNLDPDEIVTVSANATQAYENGTTIWLKEGEKISVRDLIYGALLESGNDAAYALGEAVSGSEKDFADLMNETVTGWGCNDTHFVNANGWKNAEHYTTAADLAVITAKCLESSELREIAMTKTYTAAETNLTGERKFQNYLLHVTGSPDGLTGGKTGTWDDDDCAVVCSFSQTGLEAVIVVLGDTEDGRPEDVRKLMAFSHEVTPGFIVPANCNNVETAWVKHGEKTRTTLAVDGWSYAYPASSKADDIITETEYESLKAPLKKGQEVGTLKIYVKDKLIGEHKLLATEDIDTGWLPSYLYISNSATLKAIKVIGLFVLLLLLVSLAGSRLGRGKKRRKRRNTKAAADRSGNAGSRSSDMRKNASRSAGAQTGTAEVKRGEVRRSTSKVQTISRKEKKEARKRLREKYRDKH